MTTRKRSASSIYDHDSVAPDATEISASMGNAANIAAWFSRAILYTEAMQGVNRAVLLRIVDGTLYLSSIPQEDPR